MEIIGVYGVHCFSLFILSRCSFSWGTNKIGILTINAPQSLTAWFYNFPLSSPPWFFWLSDSSDFWTDSIVLWGVYFCNKHFSCDKWNYFQLNLNHITPRLFTQLLLLLFFASHFQFLTGAGKQYTLKHQSVFHSYLVILTFFDSFWSIHIIILYISKFFIKLNKGEVEFIEPE